jgi:hypothetical protein
MNAMDVRNEIAFQNTLARHEAEHAFRNILLRDGLPGVYNWMIDHATGVISMAFRWDHDKIEFFEHYDASHPKWASLYETVMLKEGTLHRPRTR